MKLKYLFCSIVIVGLMIATSFSVLSSAPVGMQPVKVIVLGDVSHTPIYINGNAALAYKASVEKWPGDGSSGNPYVISNYAISATSMNALQIMNTNAHITILNITVTSTSHANKGIYLTNCNNVDVNKCTANDCSYGIYAATCSWINITECNGTSSLYNGITVLTTTNLFIFDCYANLNSGQGFNVISCPDAIIIGGAFSNILHGMYIRLCDHAIVRNSAVQNNGKSGIYISGCDSATVKDSSPMNNANSGITFAACTNSLAESVMSWYNSHYGIRSDTSTGTTLSSCSLLYNLCGPHYP